MSRFDELAARLVAVEAKVAVLAGYGANSDVPGSLDEIEARLGLVECTVGLLVTTKTQEHIDAIVAAPADAAPVAVEDVVALSASADVPEAAEVVADVVQAQVEAEPVEHAEVAEVIAVAVQTVVHAEPEVVTVPEAITAAILEAVAELPAPAPEAVEAAVAAVAEVIAIVTGVDEVAPEVTEQISSAVSAQADPVLDAVEGRLDTVEAKVDTLLGK
jgi:hypothetical protein